jgi:acetone carboxylase gamma subunit
MLFKCQNKKCRNEWSTFDGYICPKCGQVHKAGKAVSELWKFMISESERLALKVRIKK